MADFEVFRRFVQHVRIVHHIPGRVRFKLLDLALDEEGKALLGGQNSLSMRLMAFRA